jgi:hypothetical protein
MTDTVMQKGLYKLFLSYDPADEILAEKLRTILSKRSDVRLVFREIDESEDSKIKASKELESCNCFVVIISRHALRSTWVLQELGAAWGLGKAIIPIMTQPGLQLPIQVDGLIPFKPEQVLVADHWDKILVYNPNGYFNFPTKNPFE